MAFIAAGGRVVSIANIRILVAMIALALSSAVSAANVTVVGLFPGKALVVINNGVPRTLSIGQRSPEGVKLVAADAKSATFEFEGKKQVLEIGEHFATTAPGSVPTVTLAADTRGHFVVIGTINGGSVRHGTRLRFLCARIRSRAT